MNFGYRIEKLEAMHEVPVDFKVFYPIPRAIQGKWSKILESCPQ
jgi:hypothetical protein